MVLMCQRLLPATRCDIYLQGAASFKLPKRHFTVKVYCSPHNPGARELAEELNAIWPGLLQVAHVRSWSDLSTCDHMLVYLNGLTWTHGPEPFAAEIREALRMGLHLQPCHEFPSVIDPGSDRHALEFKQVMDATPADLKKWPTNLYSQIAIALKGGALREPGLSNLAQRLVQRNSSGRSVKTTYDDIAATSVPVDSPRNTRKASLAFGLMHRRSFGSMSRTTWQEVNAALAQPVASTSRSPRSTSTRLASRLWPIRRQSESKPGGRDVTGGGERPSSDKHLPRSMRRSQGSSKPGILDSSP